MRHRQAKAKSEKPALTRLAYTMREVAALLGVGYQTIFRWRKRGLLKSVDSPRLKLIPASEIERFLTIEQPKD